MPFRASCILRTDPRQAVRIRSILPTPEHPVFAKLGSYKAMNKLVQQFKLTYFRRLRHHFLGRTAFSEYTNC